MAGSSAEASAEAGTGSDYAHSGIELKHVPVCVGTAGRGPSEPVLRVGVSTEAADKPTLMLLDGNSLAFRAFFALARRELQDQNG